MTTTCEECGGEYPDALGHCPHCAVVKLQDEARHNAKLMRGGVIAVELIIFALILAAAQLTYFAQRPSGTPSSTLPAVTEIVSTNSSSSSGIWIPRNGEVIVTLTLPKSAMGGSAKASQEARGLASTVLGSVPTASSVAVFDGNTTLIGRYRR